MKEKNGEKTSKKTGKIEKAWQSFRGHIQKIQWKRAFSWLGKIPWKAMLKRIRKIKLRRLLPACCFLICLGVLLSGMAFVISAAVCDKTQDRILTKEQLQDMEGEFDCILVLGCRVYDDGRLSHMLEDRVSTAVTLYQAGVCETILMSGDSQTENYDEVGTMKNAAIEAGVPEDAIVTDPAGLSTYDSIARLLRVYEGKRVIIVTQNYHLYRALYIAEKMDVEAYGVSADLRPYSGQFKYEVREIFARCKDVVYALKQPQAAEAFS